MMTSCPYCGVHAASPCEEVAHMESSHPEVIVERLRKAGEHQAADDFAKSSGLVHEDPDHSGEAA